MGSSTKPIPVRLDEKTLERLRKISEQMGEPVSTVMRFAIRAGLPGIEAIFREYGDAEAALRAIRTNEMRYPAHRPEGMYVEERPKKKKAN